MSYEDVTHLADAAPFSHEWRRWIAENILLGQPSEPMIDAMVRAGLDRSASAREIDIARAHPYVKIAAQLAAGSGGAAADCLPDSLDRVAKREWVLEVYRRLAMLDPATASVPSACRPSRERFLHNFYAANRPVLIEGAMHDWPAMTEWTPIKLHQRFGDREVEIQVGRNADPDYQRKADDHKRVMPFGNFVTMVGSSRRTNDVYMTGGDSGKNRQSLRELWNDIGPLPEYFDSRAATEHESIWFGPAGTITPLHHDLTNRLLAQVVGRKRVWLIAPYDTPYVYEQHDRFSAVQLHRIDYVRFPLFRKALLLEVVLHPGQMLFVPVGWWHHATALDVSITMSFANFVFDNFYKQQGT